MPSIQGAVVTCSSDRWSCDRCPPGSGTFVAVGTQADTAAAIRAVQTRHAEAHRRAATVLGRLGLPESHPKRKRKAA